MTQGELEKIPIGLQQIFLDLEQDIMADIVDGIREIGFSSQSTDYNINTLRNFGDESEEIEAMIRDALELSDQEIERALSDAAYQSWYGASKVYDVAGFDHLPYEENITLQNIVGAAIRQTQKETQNLSHSFGFAMRGPDGRIQVTPVRQAYNRIIDKAVLSINTGAYSYDTALRRAIKSMTGSGLRVVYYESGATARADVAARRAIMTGFRQIQGYINEQLAADIGTDKYEVSWHAGARPSHQTWQGRVYTYDELESVCGLGDVTGLHGANCYHDYVPFLEGFSKRVYTDEWLDAMNAEENTPQDYNGKSYTKYEALQEQRRRERAMRAQRKTVDLMKKGGAAKEAVQVERTKYKVKLNNYRDFSQKMKLPEAYDRIYQDGLGTV